MSHIKRDADALSYVLRPLLSQHRCRCQTLRRLVIETDIDMDLSRSRFLDSDVAVQAVAEHSNQQPAPVNDPHAVHDHVDGSEEAEAFLQPAFIGIISELSAITEGVLLPDSAHIEAEAKVCLTITVHHWQSTILSNMACWTGSAIASRAVLLMQ